MAEKRMISKVISISEKVNELPDIFDMLLFTWMIPHTDDFGRLAGTPAKVLALVVPMLDKTKADVNESLEHLQAAGLIKWYESEGQKVVQIENFEAHQSGLHKRTRSKFPDPPDDYSTHFPEVPGSSEQFQKIPLELNRTEENRTELKRTEEKRKEENRNEKILDAGRGLDDVNLFRLFESEGFGTLSSVISDQITCLERDYGNRWVAEAMKAAVLSGKRTVRYVGGILKNWKANGIDEPWKQDTSPAASRGRNGKPKIEVVSASPNPDEPELSEKEFEEMMRFAAEQQASKKQEVPQ